MTIFCTASDRMLRSPDCPYGTDCNKNNECEKLSTLYLKAYTIWYSIYIALIIIFLILVLVWSYMLYKIISPNLINTHGFKNVIRYILRNKRLIGGDVTLSNLILCYLLAFLLIAISVDPYG
jgi:hypothetical protein